MSVHVSNIEYLVLESATNAWSPPPPVDYLKWAKDNIEFTERESSFPGPYNEDLFPYFSEILNALSPDDPCRIVTISKSAQLGGTVLANIFCGGTLDIAPCDFMYIHPTEGNARRWSNSKLKPMLKNTPALSKIFAINKSRDGADSTLFKERVDGRGSMLISGANSAASLSMVSIPKQVQDDLSKWEMNNAGDPEDQADSRSQGYEFAKIAKIGTPLVDPGCRITKNYLEGSQETFLVPCPHCDFAQTFEWENMLANLDDNHPEKAHFTCIDCGCEIQEYHRADMVKKALVEEKRFAKEGGIKRLGWIAENPTAKRFHRSFHIWSAYSALQSFERIARRWISSKGDTAGEQTFFNDVIGRVYKTDGDAPPWEELRDRAGNSDYNKGQCPARALVITVGIDCQGDRIEWQAVGWGRDGYRAVIDHGVVSGHISEKNLYKRFDAVLSKTFKNPAGNLIHIERAAIDGNAYTEDVWEWAKRHPIKKLIMVRGVGQDYAPIIIKVKKQRSSDGKRLLKYSSRFYNFAASVLKLALYRRVRKTNPEEFGYVDFPRGLEDEYFMQLTAERRVAKVDKKTGFTTYIWKKDPSQDNEMLDTMNQAATAANNLNIREMVDSEWDRLEALRMTPPPEVQLDLEDLPLVAATKSPQKPKSKVKSKRPAKRQRKRGGWMSG